MMTEIFARRVWPLVSQREGLNIQDEEELADRIAGLFKSVTAGLDDANQAVVSRWRRHSQVSERTRIICEISDTAGSREHTLLLLEHEPYPDMIDNPVDVLLSISWTEEQTN